MSCKAGEYIQVIDVSGRQCTDFQAFAARKVERGLDLALDATVTRTLLGRSYPTPGLPSKAFDREFEPLVEIVQDTVGRHDAFATACNSRYYDDMGYPGHVNCTENFNPALAPYGIAPRKGWEAINYFYNTNIDQQQPALSRRAVVAARRLCADAGADRSRLRVVVLSRRHRCGQWLGPDRHPCPHLFRQTRNSQERWPIA